jgi:hypothetical protein
LRHTKKVFVLTTIFFLGLSFSGSVTYALSRAATSTAIDHDCPKKPDYHEAKWQKVCIEHGAVNRDGSADLTTCAFLVNFWWHDQAARIDLAFVHPAHCE